MSKSDRQQWIFTGCVLVLFLALATIVSHGQASVTVEQITGVETSGGKLKTLSESSNGVDVDPQNRVKVVGPVANDADSTGVYPLMLGCRASIAVPAAVSADGDNVYLRCSRTGAIQFISTAGTSTLANVSGSATSVTLIAANTARLFAKCYNDSTAILYINYGATASATAFTEYVPPGATWTMDQPIYTGAINGLWASATGSARCTELTQ